MGAMWDRYKDGYERYLHPEPVLDEEEAPAEEAPEDAEAPGVGRAGRRHRQQ